MNIAHLTNWFSSDLQARIKPLLIPLIMVELEEEHAINIIKVKMWRNPDFPRQRRTT